MVFDNLIGHLDHPQSEKMALRFHQWSLAVDAWSLDFDVCNHIEMLTLRYNIPVEVITWKPVGFAHALSDRFGDIDLPVREVKSGTYHYFSPRYAVDPEITAVYDPDPEHAHGYGFKRREFILGTP